MMSVMRTVVQEVKQRRRIKACGTISDVVLVVQILIEFGWHSKLETFFMVIFLIFK
jgi:hypothetical protein